MLLSLLVIIPIIGIVTISSINAIKVEKMIALTTSIINLIISLIIFNFKQLQPLSFLQVKDY